MFVTYPLNYSNALIIFLYLFKEIVSQNFNGIVAIFIANTRAKTRCLLNAFTPSSYVYELSYLKSFVFIDIS